jgi:hypothetical protein
MQNSVTGLVTVHDFDQDSLIDDVPNEVRIRHFPAVQIGVFLFIQFEQASVL